MNISTSANNLSEILSCIGQPARILILLSLSKQEACVCHLEAVLGMSQASISQHLMILRKKGLVKTRRDGRHIYYSLVTPSVVDIFYKTAIAGGIDIKSLESIPTSPLKNCSCPICNPGLDQRLVCKKPKVIKN